MSIYSTAFAVYERLASAKMNAFAAAINAHTHDGTNGVKIPFSYLDGFILPGQISPGTITGTMIANNTITNVNIAPGTITETELNITNIHMVDGYAVYAP
jgi:hypothetical protein